MKEFGKEIVKSGVECVLNLTGVPSEASAPIAMLLTNLAFSTCRKRVEAFGDKVAVCLDTLRDNGELNLDSLKTDANFQTVLIMALTIVPRIHQEQKINVLLQAVANSAVQIDISEDCQHVFLGYIEKLTPTHLLLLHFFMDNEKKYFSVESYDELYQDFKSYFHNKSSVGILFPDSRDHFKLFCNELIACDLIKLSQTIDDFKDMEEDTLLAITRQSGMLPRVRITDVGKSFMRYITQKK